MPRQAAALANAELVVASACRMPDGTFGAALASERGAVIATLKLPARGHDVVRCPVTGRLAVFAWRPGTFAMVFDTRGNAVATLTSPAGRHFFGHGSFSPDGRLLYATENDFETADGKIAIYDATSGFARIGEFNSYGIDPHEMMLMGENLICVANGGIETHPDYGREKLNLATMRPNVAFIDRHTGDLLSLHELPQRFHQVSLRHLAPDATGRVWVGAQYEGPAADDVPLLMRLGPDEDFFIPDVAPTTLHALGNYVGSVASSADGELIMAASPVGNSALILDTASGETAIRHLKNVCGTEFDGRRPILSTGNGGLAFGDAPPERFETLFDHHLVVVPG
ncbi:MAG: DUF1513 domain-containing protein [Alphaproteobacteria bacterium]|nr:DUF1513 domain-containing protein [Alphaproteobacteria bacterium]